jgi:hypothetical protein
MEGIIGAVLFFGAILGATFMFLNRGQNDLIRGFESLGDMTGMSYADIAAVVRDSKFRQSVEGGWQAGWFAGNYSVVLAFDEQDLCTGLVSETQV